MAYPSHAQELEESRAEIVEIAEDWSSIGVTYHGSGSQLIASLDHEFELLDEIGRQPSHILLRPIDR